MMSYSFSKARRLTNLHSPYFVEPEEPKAVSCLMETWVLGKVAMVAKENSNMVLCTGIKGHGGAGKSASPAVQRRGRPATAEGVLAPGGSVC